MSNYNDDLQKKLANQILKLNERYLNHMQKIEDGFRGCNLATGGASGSGFSGGNFGTCEYKKNYAGGARITASLPEFKPISEVAPELKPVSLPEQQEFTLPTIESTNAEPKQDEDSWFHKAVKHVVNFFGGRKPTAKEKKEIELIFKNRGHDIKSPKQPLKGGFKVGDLGNMDFWNNIRIEGGKKTKLKGGFNLGDLGNMDFWKNLRVEGGCNPTAEGAGGSKQLKGGNWIDDIGDFFTNSVNATKDAVVSGAHSIGLGKTRKVKIVKTKKKPTARAELVRKIMGEHNCSMVEASSYIKQNKLQY